MTFITGLGADDTQCITVTGIPDMAVEGTEFITVSIQADTTTPPQFVVKGMEVGFREMVTLIILDNDAEGIYACVYKKAFRSM